MTSRVYLSDEFLSHLVNKTNDLTYKITNIEIPTKVLNYQKIRQIIAKSNLYFACTHTEIVEIIRKNENPTKTIILKRLIKGTFSKNYDVKLDFSLPNTIFFVGDEDCSKISLNHNVLCKGANYDFEEVFFKNPLRTVFNKKMVSEDFSNSFHYCKNIILIDPFIFAKNFHKRESLINFFETCFNFKNKRADKHLTLITNFSTSVTDTDFVENKTITKYLKILSEELNMKMENISVLRHVGNEFQGNRHLVTDYALMDLQHVFDRDNGVVSGLYFYNDDIESNFLKGNELIKRIKNLNEVSNEKYTDSKDPKVKHNRLKFGNILNNPLFH